MTGIACAQRTYTSQPMPRHWAYPGHTEPSPGAKKLTGVRANIVHAMFWSGIPSQADKKIDELPSEDYFRSLSRVQKDYLSFTVYSLKQMTVAGILPPHTAWMLLNGQNGELRTISEVDASNFAERRRDFFRYTMDLFPEYRNNDLLRFEFFARAGEAGLKQFADFNKYSIVFKGVPKYLQEEYRKALWLEMRLIEDQVGIEGLNPNPVTKFIFKKKGYYCPYEEKIKGSIDFFRSNISESVIDGTIKAEIGHWYFESYDIHCECNWASELMDRMNISGFTKAVNLAFHLPSRLWSPMQRAFLTGGYFLDAKDESFPTFPDSYTVTPGKDTEAHITAEYVEAAIRRRIVRAVSENELRAEDAYQTYRRIGLNIAVLDRAGNSLEEILRRIERHTTQPKVSPSPYASVE